MDGEFRLGERRFRLRRSRPSDVEQLIRYGVAPAERGQGIATALLRLVTDWVFSNGIARRVEAVIGPANAASVRVVTKVGFRYEGTRRDIVEGTGAEFEDHVYVQTANGSGKHMH